jgi:hypothetical protein
MVYGPNPFVHHSNCLYNPTNSRKEGGRRYTHNTEDKREKRKYFRLHIEFRERKSKKRSKNLEEEVDRID